MGRAGYVKNTLLTCACPPIIMNLSHCLIPAQYYRSGLAMNNLPQVYRKYELLFTPNLIPELRNLRGDEWTQLIDYLAPLPETHPDAIAFAVMMINLGGCLPCEMDSYRAQRGCASCAKQTVIGFKGNDKQLLKRYEKAQSFVADQSAPEQPQLSRAA